MLQDSQAYIELDPQIAAAFENSTQMASGKQK